MKIYNKYLLTAILAALTVSSCDLDKFPEGQYVTEEQLEETNELRPNMVVSAVNAMAARMNFFGTISDDANTYHSDFGVPAVAIQLESGGQDFVSTTSGYNWFNRSQNYADRDYSMASGAEFIWKVFYNHILAANKVLLEVPKEIEDPDLQIYRGQALASRAYDYLNLVQCFQFTYAGHESALGIPLVSEDMTEEEKQNNPRATVQQVYDRIIADLTEAIGLLEGYDNGDNKDKIDIYTAYGLRARAHLLMQKWTDAAQDAAKAIAGGTPQSLSAVSEPTFNSATASSWLWGILITPDNDVVATGIINWPSHLCSFTGNGYTTGTGAFRHCSSTLYNQIPDTDIRKQWFVSPDGTSGLVDEDIIDSFGLDEYANTKFGAYESVFGNSTNASDWPLMRVEEMYLIKAESEAMGGNLPAGKQTLEDFVTTYRDPGFQSTATTAQELQDEVWLQRRMELWGEGFALYDILRLKKPVIRKNTNYSASVQFNLEPESQILIYRIPQAEMETNQGITDADNNPAAPQPTL